MENNEFTIPIPARLKNVAKGGHVAGAKDIIDDALGKEQSEINIEVSEAIYGNTEAVAAERQRAIATEDALDNRLSDVEELAEISIDGGEAKIATGEDFHNPTAEQRAKVTTVGAILDGADDEPTAGSDNPVKSGGVDYESQKIIEKQSTLIDMAEVVGLNAVKIEIDKAGNLIYLIHPDGSKRCFTKVYFNKGIETQESGNIDSAIAKSFNEIDANDRKQFNIASIEKTNNELFVKMTIDKAGKIIKAYDVNGKEFFFAAAEFQGDFKSNNIDGQEFIEYDLNTLTYISASVDNNRCWLDGIINAEFGNVVVLKSQNLVTYETSIVIYNSNNEVIASSSFTNCRDTITLTLPQKSATLRLSIKKKDNSAITEVEGRSAISSLIYSRNTFEVSQPLSENYVRQITKSYIHRYNGETIDFNDAGSYEFIPYLTIPNWLNSQGGAIHKDYLVTTIASDVNGYDGTTPNAFIFDLKNGNKINDLYLGRTIDGVEYSWPHCNQVCFGNEYYNENSDFPLLYVSMVNGGTGEASIFGKRGVFVYDIHLDGSSTLVQVIYPDLTDTALMDKIGAYTPNYIVDTDNNRIVILGYHNASWYDYSGGTPVCIINLPTVSDGETIVFTNNDVIDAYLLEDGFGQQQSFYHNGKVYIQSGLGGVGSTKSIRVLDLAKKEIVTYIDLSYRELEPQFIGLWKTKLLWYDAGTSGIVSEIKLGY